jgi:hypothetical protein
MYCSSLPNGEKLFIETSYSERKRDPYLQWDFFTQADDKKCCLGGLDHLLFTPPPPPPPPACTVTAPSHVVTPDWAAG